MVPSIAIVVFVVLFPAVALLLYGFIVLNVLLKGILHIQSLTGPQWPINPNE